MDNIGKFRKIKAFLFDMEGVLCDPNLLVFGDGKIARQFYQKDLMAIRLAVRHGFPIGVISVDNLHSLEMIFLELGISNIFQQSTDKKEDYLAFRDLNELNDEQIVYMGADLPDYRAMRIVGLPTCPIDAANEIKDISIYISPERGGKGCVRDVIERVLKVKNKWLEV